MSPAIKGELSMSTNDPDIQNIAAGTSEGDCGIAGNSVLGAPPDPPVDRTGANGAESVPPDDTGLATGTEDDPGYDSVRPTGGSIDREPGA